MATVCPYCNMEVRESAIEAEDGCCLECGAMIGASSSFLDDPEENEDDLYYTDENDDVFSDLDDDDNNDFARADLDDEFAEDFDLDDDFADDDFDFDKDDNEDE